MKHIARYNLFESKESLNKFRSSKNEFRAKRHADGISYITVFSKNDLNHIIDLCTSKLSMIYFCDRPSQWVGSIEDDKHYNTVRVLKKNFFGSNDFLFDIQKTSDDYFLISSTIKLNNGEGLYYICDQLSELLDFLRIFISCKHFDEVL